jgi:hypothetical protein
MTIENDDRAAEKQRQSVKPAVIAELTWAQLYTKSMHKDIVAISIVINKNRSNVFGTEMKKSAEQLRDQLQSANRTVDELRDQAGIRAAPVKK